MNRLRLNQLHKEALSYGQWQCGGRDRVGIGSAWPDIPTREALEDHVGERLKPRRATNGQKRLYPLNQPHSSRQRPGSKALTGRIETEYAAIHGIAVQMPQEVKKIIVCLYFKAMPFRDVSLVTGLESKEVGRLKARFLCAINEIVR